MGDTITFTPNTGVSPTFNGRGSKLEHPDVLPIFLGSYWPGVGAVTVTTVMNALNAMASGPYFDGLKQYGYVGPVQIRGAQVDSSAFTVSLTPLSPGVDQVNDVNGAVGGYIGSVVDNDGIDNLDDNHDLIVLVFLDPSNPLPQKMDGAGNVAGSAIGANTEFEKFVFLDDNTRFEWAWINTAGGTLDFVTQIVSHELVESISDPFNSGWRQATPPPGPTGGQIGDVCNQNATVNGVGVAAYWSNSDNACIVPTATTRFVSLSQQTTKHEQHDEPHKQGYVNLGALCASGYYDYFERTFLTDLTISAAIEGYESPIVDWTINGTEVPFITGTVDVDVHWDPEPRAAPLAPPVIKPTVAHLKTTKLSSSATQIGIEIGPGDGNMYLNIRVAVTESFDTPNNGGKGLSQRQALLELDLKNQEIIWGSGFGDAQKQCDRIHHLVDGPGVVIGPPQPGDPANIANIINQAIHDNSSQRQESLRQAAQMVGQSHPQVAQDLMALAQRAEGP